MATGMFVSLPSTAVITCGASSELRRPAAAGRLSLGRRWSVLDGKPAKVWALRASLETRSNVTATRKGAPLLLEAGTVGEDAEWVALPDIWRTTAMKHGDRVALIDPHRNPPTEMTFNQLEQAIMNFAEGLRAAGILPNQTVALFADNSHRWLIADQGILASGAVNAVRGSRSSVEELLYIYTHSDSVALVIDNADIFMKLAPALRENSTNVKFVVLLWAEKSSVLSTNGSFLNDTPFTHSRSLWNWVKLAAKPAQKEEIFKVIDSYYGPWTEKTHDKIKSDDTATLVYTSGTTGKPKGVMLTHANLLHQVKNFWVVLDPTPSQRFLTLLPPWHMYERSCEYFYLSRGVNHVYTNVKRLKEDLIQYKPNYFVAVPLVFDLLYNGIQKQLAATTGARKTLAMALISISFKYMDAKRVSQGRDFASSRKKQPLLVAAKEWLVATVVMSLLLPLYLIAKTLVFKKIRATLTMGVAVSGGGSLPSHVDKFFEIVGIPILNGYGLTETSPVLACRLPSNNVLGTVGPPLPETLVKVVDAETNKQVEPGVKGLVKVRGPQIMKGYYKNEAATAKTIDSEGWLDTGDLGWIPPEVGIGAGRHCAGLLVLDGRAKDTIVLLTGENVEPTEIEEAMSQSTLIQHIVVLGQDQRKLGALVVVNKADVEAAAQKKMKVKGNEAKPTESDLRECIQDELRTYGVSCSHPIASFQLLYEPFTIENGLLTPTMKVRRDVVNAMFKEQVGTLFR